MSEPRKHSRRFALRVIGSTVAAAAGVGVGRVAADDQGDEPAAPTTSSWFRRFFAKHYRKMSKEEVEATIARLEKKYSKKYGREVNIDNTPAPEGVLYGYALNIDRCKGYRDCVDACVKENNLSRERDMQYIRVFEMEQGTVNFATADPYYDHDEVPEPGHFYLPVQCFQCENPPCVKVCPVEATWMEGDGVVVVDYERCIGCRYCMTACPYWARRFNWREAEIPASELNLDTHYLSNRPRPRGVVEKCTFCLHRVRDGRNPACQDACPTGARVFGNLLDPKSEIRYVLEHKTVFRLKEDLGTEPKFWYYSG